MRTAFLTLMVALATAWAGCSTVPSATNRHDAVACPPIYNGCFAD